MDKNKVYLIEVTEDWLNMFKNAAYQAPDGTWLRMGWIEPVGEHGTYRILTIPYSNDTWVGIQDPSQIFSRN